MKLFGSVAAIVAVVAVAPAAAFAKSPLYKATLSGRASQVISSTEDITYQYDTNCDGAITETQHNPLSASFNSVKAPFPLSLPGNATVFPRALVEHISNASGESQDQLNSTLTPKPFAFASDCPSSGTATQTCSVANPKPDFDLSADTKKGPLSFYPDSVNGVFGGCGMYLNFLGRPVVTKLKLSTVRKLHKGHSVKASGKFAKSYVSQVGVGPAVTVAIDATYSLKIKRTR